VENIEIASMKTSNINKKETSTEAFNFSPKKSEQSSPQKSF
jgi:hypothetical protein